mgnify:CR=1 FL=1
MAKLYFNYSTMNAGKSAVLLQASHNYRERGMETYLLTARIDGRAGTGRIASRIGIGADAELFSPGDDLFARIETRLAQGPVACIFIDEAQFLEPAQVWQLARVVDDLDVPVLAYGLRVDFRGELFPGSATLLALADEMREVRTICRCGRKATMVIRQDAEGRAITEGAQVQIGGNETYVSLCRRHWREEMGDLSLRWEKLWQRFIKATQLPDQQSWTTGRYVENLPEGWSENYRAKVSEFLIAYRESRFGSEGLTAIEAVEKSFAKLLQESKASVRV